MKEKAKDSQVKTRLTASITDPCAPLAVLVRAHSVGRLKRHMAEICVKAVLAVADLDRKDVNLDLIKVWGLKRRGQEGKGSSYQVLQGTCSYLQRGTNGDTDLYLISACGCRC